MRIKLVTETAIIALHSLAGYEKPHPHLWKMEWIFTGNPVNGMIVDLPSLIDSLKAMLKPFEMVYFNEAEGLSPAARAFPTCETLGVDFARMALEQVLPKFLPTNPSLTLYSLKVTLCDPETREAMGSAIVEP